MIHSKREETRNEKTGLHIQGVLKLVLSVLETLIKNRELLMIYTLKIRSLMKIIISKNAMLFNAKLFKN